MNVKVSMICSADFASKLTQKRYFAEQLDKWPRQRCQYHQADNTRSHNDQ